MKKFFEEFRDFALRGNVMQLAVGVIIGAAFQGVVTSLTDNIISPVLGLLGGMNFDAMQATLFGGALTIRYGAFLTSLINFILMAFLIFLLVRGMNRLATLGKKGEGEPSEDPATMQCPFCLTQIPYGAARCPNCTAELTPAQVEKAQAGARGGA